MSWPSKYPTHCPHRLTNKKQAKKVLNQGNEKKKKTTEQLSCFYPSTVILSYFSVTQDWVNLTIVDLFLQARLPILSMQVKIFIFLYFFSFTLMQSTVHSLIACEIELKAYLNFNDTHTNPPCLVTPQHKTVLNAYSQPTYYQRPSKSPFWTHSCVGSTTG